MSTRPAAKRVRSDQDHAKADVKEREEDIQVDKGNKKEEEKQGKKEDEEGHKDEEWMSKPPYSVGQSWEGWETKWRGSCWCNKTAFVYCTDPEQVKYCHCEDCQRLHGAPMQMAAVFHKKNVRLDSSPEWLGFLSAHGEIHPLSHTFTPLPHKISCRACGSSLFDEGRNMIMAFPPSFEFPRNQKELERMNEIDDEDAGEGGHGDKQGKDKEGKKSTNDGEGEDGTHDGPTGEGGKPVQTHRRKGKWSRYGLPDELKPQSHIFYERRVMDVKDGLLKWRAAKESEEMGEEEQ